jgi:hypothetical protein
MAGLPRWPELEHRGARVHRPVSDRHCYGAQAVPRTLLDELDLQTTGFELDHEITSKVLARGCRIVEVPIQYFPRSREEGKKIGAKDWVRGLRTFWRYRRG